MQRFLRKWHRWIGFPASIFLLFAAVTGMLLAGTEFFGAEEALRERTRDLISPTTTLTPDAEFAAALARSRSSVSALTGNAPIDQIVWQFKGETPTIVFFLGKPTGREDRKVTVNARTGTVLRTEVYADKPFLLRLHSGEAFGDGGLVLAMFWGFSLVLTNRLRDHHLLLHAPHQTFRPRTHILVHPVLPHHCKSTFGPGRFTVLYRRPCVLSRMGDQGWNDRRAQFEWLGIDRSTRLELRGSAQA